MTDTILEIKTSKNPTEKMKSLKDISLSVKR